MPKKNKFFIEVKVMRVGATIVDNPFNVFPENIYFRTSPKQMLYGFAVAFAKGAQMRLLNVIF